MGRLVNAGALLRAVENGGHDMKLPNVYLVPAESRRIDLARFFVSGESLSYSAKVADAGIATVGVTGTVMTVTGVAEGFTTVDITVDDKVYTVTVTVRDSANSNGWM